MTHDPNRRLVLLGAGATLALAAPAVHAQAPQRFMTVQAGRLPIILTAPHGGEMVAEGIAERAPGGPFGAVVVRDANTSELATAAAREIATLAGAPAHLVVAHITRRQIDLNRPAEAAFDPGSAATARPIWEAYHGAVSAAARAVVQRHRAGLLIDIHGHGADPGLTYRGTVNGATVRGLVSCHGEAAHLGPDSLMGRLAAEGLAVHPAVDSRERENPRFVGGYTVRRYAEQHGDAIAAIQIEFGARARSAGELDQTAQALARAAVAVARRFFGAG